MTEIKSALVTKFSAGPILERWLGILVNRNALEGVFARMSSHEFKVPRISQKGKTSIPWGVEMYGYIIFRNVDDY